MAQSTRQEDLFDPGSAEDFFALGPVAPFNPALVREFSRDNALWLAEFSRLIYRRNADEAGGKPGVRSRAQILAPTGWQEVEFIRHGSTEAAVLVHPGLGAACLVFRGTLGEADLVTDARLLTVPWRGKGHVHLGFREALGSIWDRIEARLRTLGQPVFFTGHSLGGALATLAAARVLQTTSLTSPAAVYTFGSPRVGDATFGSAFTDLFHCRVVNDHDLVPTIPPAFSVPLFPVYQHTGEKHQLRSGGVLEIHSNGADIRTTRNPLAGVMDFTQNVSRLLEQARAGGPIPDNLLDHAPVNYVRRLLEVAPHPGETARSNFLSTPNDTNTHKAMIVDLVKKDELQEHVKVWQRLVTRALEGLKKGGDPKVLAAAQKYGWKLEELEALDAFLKKAAAGFNHEADAVFIAPEEELSILQTIMEAAYTKAGLVEKSGGQGLAQGVPAVSSLTLKPEIEPSAGQSLFYSDFDDPNPLFITEGIKAVAYRLFHGKHAFSDTPPTVPLAKKARLIVVGDWGSGIERAGVIAKLMAAQVVADRECHMVHLGDIYFCGWPGEAQERFLDQWPVKTGPSGVVASWNLNGNHDMYCGGAGYFDVVLGDPRFAQQKGCSYFALENDHWQILGLDTSYEEWGLSGNQLSWAQQKRVGNPDKKGILLSHHQPYSDYEKDGSGKKSTRLLNIVAPLLKGQTTAWLWGHEHRAVVYQNPSLPLADGSQAQLPLGACLGNGGVPSRPTKLANPATSVHAETGSFRAGLEKFGLFGFAVLDLDGDQGELTVYNEKGAAAGPFKLA